MANKANKTILLISYFFPPIGMGGVGRAYGLYRLLPQYGYNIKLITVKNIAFPNYDYTPLENINPDDIIRTGSLDPSRLSYLFGKRGGEGGEGGEGGVNAGNNRNLFKKSYLTWPDFKRGWVPFALQAAEKEISKGNCFAIITTSPPPSAHLIGLKLKRKFNIPWVADFRDLWYSLPIEDVYPTASQIKYARNLKNDIIKYADRVITVNDSIREYLDIEEEKAETIYNGFDLDYKSNWIATKLDKDKFNIGLLGTINELCPVEPLLKALTNLIGKYPELKQKLTVTHVGKLDNNIEQIIDSYQLKDILNLRGYVSKGDAITELSKCDILYFHVQEQDRFQIVPGRLFDLLASGKPIIGIAPRRGDAFKLLSEYKYGTCLSEPESDSIADAIYAQYANKQNGENSSVTDDDEFIVHSTDRMARRFAKILDQIV